MKRISITFYDEVCEQLEQKARDKNISLAHYVRQLVELGLKVEAYSEEPKSTESSLDKSVHQLKEELQKMGSKRLTRGL